MAKATTEIITGGDAARGLSAAETMFPLIAQSGGESTTSAADGARNSTAANNAPDVPVSRTAWTEDTATIGTDPREESPRLARRARDSFRSACESQDVDTAEISYLTARATVVDLWNCAKYRDRGFRDLLALLDAAITRTDFNSFDDAQKEAIRSAFNDLPRWLIDYDALDRHIERFAEVDIDVTKPVLGDPINKYKIIIQQIE
jgi:hypothetical protein